MPAVCGKLSLTYLFPFFSLNYLSHHAAVYILFSWYNVVWKSKGIITCAFTDLRYWIWICSCHSKIFQVSSFFVCQGKSIIQCLFNQKTYNIIKDVILFFIVIQWNYDIFRQLLYFENLICHDVWTSSTASVCVSVKQNTHVSKCETFVS